MKPYRVYEKVFAAKRNRLFDNRNNENDVGSTRNVKVDGFENSKVEDGVNEEETKIPQNENNEKKENELRNYEKEEKNEKLKKKKTKEEEEENDEKDEVMDGECCTFYDEIRDTGNWNVRRRKSLFQLVTFFTNF